MKAAGSKQDEPYYIFLTLFWSNIFFLSLFSYFFKFNLIIFILFSFVIIFFSSFLMFIFISTYRSIFQKHISIKEMIEQELCAAVGVIWARIATICQINNKVSQWKSHWPLFVPQVSPRAHKLVPICLVQSDQRPLLLASEDHPIWKTKTHETF